VGKTSNPLAKSVLAPTQPVSPTITEGVLLFLSIRSLATTL
jgi:hypothetical protein